MQSAAFYSDVYALFSALYASAGHSFNIVLLEAQEEDGYRDCYEHTARAEHRIFVVNLVIGKP